MRAATFKMSVDLLNDLLHFPAGARVIGVWMNGGDDTVTFTVDDPALPEAVVPHESLPTQTRKEIVWNWNVDNPGASSGTQT